MCMWPHDSTKLHDAIQKQNIRTSWSYAKWPQGRSLPCLLNCISLLAAEGNRAIGGVSLHSCCRSHAECNGNVTAQLDKISNYFQGNKIICVNIYMGSTDSVNDQNKTANYNVRVCSINAVIFNNKVWGKWFAPAHIYRNNMQQNTFILSSARFWQAVRAATTGRKCDGIVHFPGTIIQVAFPVRICGSFPFPMATYSSAEVGLAN